MSMERLQILGLSLPLCGEGSKSALRLAGEKEALGGSSAAFAFVGQLDQIRDVNVFINICRVLVTREGNYVIARASAWCHVVTWLILPVVIHLSQGLTHACVSIV